MKDNFKGYIEKHQEQHPELVKAITNYHDEKD